MSETAGWIALNEQQRERLRRFVDRLSDDDLLRVAPVHGDWTVADTLVHLAYYDRRAEVLIRKFLREGVSPSAYDVQTINEALLPLGRRIPPREAAAEALAAAEAADSMAEQVSPELLEAMRSRHEVTPERWIHRKAHLDDMERMLGVG